MVTFAFSELGVVSICILSILYSTVTLYSNVSLLNFNLPLLNFIFFNDESLSLPSSLLIFKVYVLTCPLSLLTLIYTVLFPNDKLIVLGPNPFSKLDFESSKVAPIVILSMSLATFILYSVVVFLKLILPLLNVNDFK